MNQLAINPNERIRILESDNSMMRDRLIILNQGLIESHKKLTQELNILASELKEVRSEISELKTLANNLLQDMAQFAKKDQVKTLEKYINLWNPLHFTTEQDVLRIIQEKRGVKHRSSSKAKNK
ncbi:MAG TPA: hypothetical protein VJH95_06440 [Candidatus Nanoarchaeia archaeon]|nr:hypothetical protein [Candidatus Nanoarchaeia archaeon]